MSGTAGTPGTDATASEPENEPDEIEDRFPDEIDDAPPDDDGEPGPSEEGEPSDQTDAAGDSDPEAETPPEADAGETPDQALVAAREESRQLRAEVAQLRAHVLAPKQVVPEKPKPWAPGSDDPEVVRAWEAVSENPEAAKSLPPDLAARVSGMDRAIRSKWTTYQRDPAALVRDHVIPMLQDSKLVRVVQELQSEIATIKGREILAKHAGAISTPQDRTELARLLDLGLPSAEAIRVMSERKELAALRAGKGKPAGNKDAERAKARAAQANKKEGQRPGRPGTAPKTTNVRELLEHFSRVHEEK